MMKMTKMTTLLAMLSLGGTLLSCAKKRQYENVFVENSHLQVAKSDLADLCRDINDPCVYIPSQENSPYNVSDAFPYFLGSEKLVVTDLREKELTLLQIEEDERFQENINNASPVLSIPLVHLDYRCKEDEFGDCTNKEELNTEIPWQQKRFVKFDLDKIKIEETNTLPTNFSELFGCFTEKKQRVVKHKFEKNALNFVVEKTYDVRPNCLQIRSIEELRYRTFSVEYGFSLVKLSSIADKDYQPLKYSRTDESFFGFFKTKRNRLNSENLGSVMGSTEFLLNRWSPNKNEISYYLNADFYKPQYASVLRATEMGFDTINRSLELAHAPFRLSLKPAEDRIVSDLRDSHLIMVTDPQASGVVGYGPSVVNPKTGEILSARTVMYLGTLVKFISSTYDEFVDEHNDKAFSLLSGNTAQVSTEALSLPPATENAKSLSLNQLTQSFEIPSAQHFHLQLSQSHFNFDEILRNFNSHLRDRDSVLNNRLVQNDQARPLDDMMSQAMAYKKRIEDLSKKNFFHASHVNFEAALLDSFATRVNPREKLKYWDNLTEEERAAIIDELLPFVWISTLVHEIGHNLGLRHNFAGSTDKENFYSRAEGQSLGMDREVKYSSIMDYPYKQTKALTVMGKYDIAALRFAYAREVKDETGAVVQLGDRSMLELIRQEQKAFKRYGYCSDEHVGADPLCHRFDEGTTSIEVAKHFQESFEKNYRKRNFRNRRMSFESRWGDLNYLFSLFGQMFNMRVFFEIYDQQRFLGRYDRLDSLSPDEKASLLLIKESADFSFNSLMSILEQPAYHCVEFNTQNQQVQGAMPFVDIAKNYGVPFDFKEGCNLLDSNQGPTRIYQFGKYFNNALDVKLDRELIDQNDPSQIDVRGIWMDKLMAGFMMSLRFNQPNQLGFAAGGNYLDVPEYRERFLDFFDGLLKNRSLQKVKILNQSGEVVAEDEVQVSYYSSHKINSSYNAFVNYFFELKQGQTSFSKALLAIMKPNLENYSMEGILSREFTLKDTFNVSQVDRRRNLSDFNFDHHVTFKRENGTDAFKFGVFSHNTKARELALIKIAFDHLKSLNRQQQVKLFQFLTGSAQPTENDAPILAVYNNIMKEEILEIRKINKNRTQSLSEVPLNMQEITQDEMNESSEALFQGIIGIVLETLSDEVLLDSFMALAQ